MKKKIIVIIMMLLLILPLNVFAASYNKTNLDEALTEEGIEHDFSKYKETDDQVTIYLFRGKGCKFCRAFLNYLNSIIAENGEYFKVESYEVWNDSANKELFENVAKFMGYDPNDKKFGIPFIVIGDQAFDGYNESYDTEILNAIKNEYNKDASERYNVLEEMNKDAGTKPAKSNTGVIIGWTIAFFVISTAIIVTINTIQYKRLDKKIDSIAKSFKNKGVK